MRFLRIEWLGLFFGLAIACSDSSTSPDFNGSDQGAAGSSDTNHPSGAGGSSTTNGASGGSSDVGQSGGSKAQTELPDASAGQGGSSNGGHAGSGGGGGSSGRGGAGGSAGAGGKGGAGGSGGAGGHGGTPGGGDSMAMTCHAEPNHSGGLTQYDRTPLGNCGEPWPSDDLYAAMATADYQNSAICGACVEITGPSGDKAVVHAVDQCPIGSNPKCVAGHIDLSHTAYNKIVHTGIGEVPNSQPVSWKYVPCNVSGPIVYHFKDASTQFWIAIQIRNSRYPISKVTYRTDGGDFHDMQSRTNDLAYFIADKPGGATFDFRVTDINGQVLEDDGIELRANADVQGHAQFPNCK